MYQNQDFNTTPTRVCTIDHEPWLQIDSEQVCNINVIHQMIHIGRKSIQIQ